MSNVKWIKLETDIFDNRKIRQIEAMPDGDTIVVIWLKLLTIAGVTNDRGWVYFTQDIPYTDELLATQFNRPINTVRLALKVFQQFQMIEVVDEVIHVSNWEKYQNIEGMEKVREQTRNRVAKYRERQKEALLLGEKTCAYCGGAGDTIDHVIPRSKGGLDIKENVVPCCLKCNMEKTNRDVAEFLNTRLTLGDAVDIERIQNNEVLQKYITFNYQSNRFENVTQNVTLRNGTDIEEDKELEKEKSSKRFTPPTLDEVTAYCKDRNNTVNPERFIAYYESNGWMVGRYKMKSWQAAVRNWEQREKKEKQTAFNSFDQRTYDYDDLTERLAAKG